ncbi:MAG: GNAT family N-acetyltransferase [Hyphomicrobiaceae bacterium]
MTYDTNTDRIRLTHGYRPGVIADIVGAHIVYYAPTWGFGLAFETKVAAELSAFLQRYDPARDLLVCATDASGAFLGSITIDGTHGHADAGAHLRWFITTDAARGSGLGRQLLTAAVDFCDAQGYATTYLTTFAGLDAARHLYERFGFRLHSETDADTWSGGSVGEQRFVRMRPA